MSNLQVVVRSNLAASKYTKARQQEIFFRYSLLAYYLSVEHGWKNQNMNRKRISRDCDVSITNACCVQGRLEQRRSHKLRRHYRSCRNAAAASGEWKRNWQFTLTGEFKGMED